MKRWLLYFHTLRYLRPIQVVQRLTRTRPRVATVTKAPRRRPARGTWQGAIEKHDPEVAPGRYRFLNLEHTVQGWNDAGVPKLWLYNLHYFEHVSTRRMEDWIAGNPAGAGNGWEPYPLSLRIANWVKWSLAGGELSARAAESLVLQSRYLASSVEYHLLANHLFANAKALVFAGAFFAGREADEWLRNGLKILEQELAEQVLADGGHFERSPMYHSLILEDVLDLVNLGRMFPEICATAPERWSRVAGRMLNWLGQMSHPDQRISFFNDAAFGVAAEPGALIQYAARLGVKAAEGELGDSGYVRLQSARALVLFDAALIGPDYQPGHAHSDTLSFELSVDGLRALLNTGISTYDNCAARQAERETAAHNTVRVDGEEQSEVWGAFRVARRARPQGVVTDRRTFAEASHDGYRRLNGRVEHRRKVELREAELVVTDRLEGRGEHRVEMFFHMHPEARLEVQWDARVSSRIDRTAWHPEFYLSVDNCTHVGIWTGRLPVELVTRIGFGAVAGAR